MTLGSHNIIFQTALGRPRRTASTSLGVRSNATSFNSKPSPSPIPSILHKTHNMIRPAALSRSPPFAQRLGPRLSNFDTIRVSVQIRA